MIFFFSESENKIPELLESCALSLPSPALLDIVNIAILLPASLHSFFGKFLISSSEDFNYQIQVFQLHTEYYF